MSLIFILWLFNRSINATSQSYQYLSYHELNARLLKLASGDCGRILSVSDLVSDRSDVFRGLDPLKCGDETCQILMTRTTSGGSGKPVVFVSGAVHGNERLGPTMVVEALEEICEKFLAGETMAKVGDAQKRSEEDVAHNVILEENDARSPATLIYELLQRVDIITIPIPNAEGYSFGQRLERGIDPNRDFPYQTESCARSFAARSVMAVAVEYAPVLALTFHGGCRTIAYPWGSTNHVQPGSPGKSSRSPDHEMFESIARVLQRVTGPLKPGSTETYYPTGSMTDTVYAVDGGMEDWLYGAGFETVPIKECQTVNSLRDGKDILLPKSSKGYVKAATFLIETSDLHTPAEFELGSRVEVFSKEPFVGHVARNIRLILKAVDLVAPRVKIAGFKLIPSVQDGEDVIKIEGMVHVVGCEQYSNIKVWISHECGGSESDGLLLISSTIPNQCHATFSFEHERAQEGVQLLKTVNKSDGLSFPRLLAGEYCISSAASFDSNWSQADPQADPSYPPMSHLALTRSNDSYRVERSGKVLLSPFHRVFHASPAERRSTEESECVVDAGNFILSDGKLKFEPQDVARSASLDHETPLTFFSGCCQGSVKDFQSVSCKACSLFDVLKVTRKTGGVFGGLMECEFRLLGTGVKTMTASRVNKGTNTYLVLALFGISIACAGYLIVRRRRKLSTYSTFTESDIGPYEFELEISSTKLGRD